MRILAVACLFICGVSFSSDVRIGIGFGVPTSPSGGYYVTRHEAVMVEPARVVREWVPARHEARVIDGHAVAIVVNPGYWREVFIPARYETRAVQEWVPVHAPRPMFSFGIGFSNWRHDHRYSPWHCPSSPRR